MIVWRTTTPRRYARKEERTLAEYLNAAMKHLNIEVLPDGEGWFISTDVFPGVWGNGATFSEAVADFSQAMEGWIALAVQRGVELPIIEGIRLDAQAA
jgi:predicted RNase H-like HicB family nuclease